MSGQSESPVSPILSLLGATSQDLAAGDVVVGAKAEPGRKVLDGRPFRHIEADFSDNGMGGESIDAIDLGQVHTGHLVEIEA